MTEREQMMLLFGFLLGFAGVMFMIGVNATIKYKKKNNCSWSEAIMTIW